MLTITWRVRSSNVFREAVQVYGLPSRLRGDRGGENVDIADFMIAQRGEGRGSFLCGHSVHNQWIELSLAVALFYTISCLGT